MNKSYSSIPHDATKNGTCAKCTLYLTMYLFQSRLSSERLRLCVTFSLSLFLSFFLTVLQLGLFYTVSLVLGIFEEERIRGSLSVVPHISVYLRMHFPHPIPNPSLNKDGIDGERRDGLQPKETIRFYSRKVCETRV
jgi:hypothetical protein